MPFGSSRTWRLSALPFLLARPDRFLGIALCEEVLRETKRQRDRESLTPRVVFPRVSLGRRAFAFPSFARCSFFQSLVVWLLVPAVAPRDSDVQWENRHEVLPCRKSVCRNNSNATACCRGGGVLAVAKKKKKKDTTLGDCGCETRRRRRGAGAFLSNPLSPFFVFSPPVKWYVEWYVGKKIAWGAKEDQFLPLEKCCRQGVE